MHGPWQGDYLFERDLSRDTCRDISYRTLLEQALGPQGFFGLACFAAGAMGSEEPDKEFYRSRRLSGGLAYGEEDLRGIFSWLDVVALRRMRDCAPDTPTFGESFLWVGLFHRPSDPAPDKSSPIPA